jgi:Xaa-Pro aminopeptidase
VSDTSALASRLDAAAVAAESAGLDALLITPGPALTYLTGYRALPLERLTCLVLIPGRAPVIVVPRLEAPAAVAAGVGDLGISVTPWDETDDAIALVAQIVGDVARVAVDDHMPAAKVLGFRSAMPSTQQELAGPIIDELMMRKAPAEIDALREAGAAIDRVHARMGEWLRAGRTEEEVGRDIADAILAEGHVTVDFVIVASGPNGASPHHEVSDRVIGVGEPVVVDIGGTMPSGYCSDCTRVYSVGAPDDEYLSHYAALQGAQQAAVQHARPGVTAESVDAAARAALTTAGLGEAFIHRTGHGIGMSTHEEPYIVAGNGRILEVGMAFSIEPGFYLEGRYGARIEDIVVLGETGAESVNLTTHDLVIL